MGKLKTMTFSERYPPQVVFPFLMYSLFLWVDGWHTRSVLMLLNYTSGTYWLSSVLRFSCW